MRLMRRAMTKLHRLYQKVTSTITIATALLIGYYASAGTYYYTYYTTTEPTFNPTTGKFTLVAPTQASFKYSGTNPTNTAGRYLSLPSNTDYGSDLESFTTDTILIGSTSWSLTYTGTSTPYPTYIYGGTAWTAETIA